MKKKELNIDNYSTMPKWTTIGLVLLSILFACKSDDDQTENPEITGEWLLIEMLADPGDGSGEFRPVDSAKRLSILTDGTWSSNGDICSFSDVVTSATSGTYEESDNGISIECAGPFPTPLQLGLDNDDNLIVAFACIEPCLQKFRRID